MPLIFSFCTDTDVSLFHLIDPRHEVPSSLEQPPKDEKHSELINSILDEKEGGYNPLISVLPTVLKRFFSKLVFFPLFLVSLGQIKSELQLSEQRCMLTGYGIDSNLRTMDIEALITNIKRDNCKKLKGWY